MESVKCNEFTKLLLLQSLVRYRSKVSFSSIEDCHAFPCFTTTYQLRKALKALIEAGYVETDFKGHNRYGYTRYFASKEGIARVGGYEAAQAAFRNWLQSPQKAESEFYTLKGLG